MKRFVEGQDRSQLILLPDCLDDYVGEDNPVRIVDAFIDELDLGIGFCGCCAGSDRPSLVPSSDTAEDTSTAISTACSRAGGSNGKRSATSS